MDTTVAITAFNLPLFTQLKLTSTQSMAQMSNTTSVSRELGIFIT